MWRGLVTAAAALYWFPLVGLLIGAMQYGAGWLVDAAAVAPWPAGMAAAALVAGVRVVGWGG